MLLSGEIDAGDRSGRAGRDDWCARSFRMRTHAAADWYRRTGAYPVNHVVCVKTALLREHPWLGAELMRMFAAAKAAAREPSAEARLRSRSLAPTRCLTAWRRTGPASNSACATRRNRAWCRRVYTPEELFFTGD